MPTWYCRVKLVVCNVYVLHPGKSQGFNVHCSRLLGVVGVIATAIRGRREDNPAKNSCGVPISLRGNFFLSPTIFYRPVAAGNAQIAVLTGMFGSDNYNWRSMTSPGITGLFNENCLRSGAANLMTCYPGDNTFDGVQTTVSLVNSNSQFHSLPTTVATNGELLRMYYGQPVVTDRLQQKRDEMLF